MIVGARRSDGKSSRGIRPLVRELLARLEAIGDRYAELYDTDVREQLAAALDQAFIRAQRCEPPAAYGMFSRKANDAVSAAVEAFLTRAIRIAEASGLDTASQRSAALRDAGIVTPGGRGYDALIGEPIAAGRKDKNRTRMPKIEREPTR